MEYMNMIDYINHLFIDEIEMLELIILIFIVNNLGIKMLCMT